MSAPSLEVLAIQAQQIQRQLSELARHARSHGLTIEAGSHDTEACCIAAENLLGMVWAGFHNAERAAVAADARA